MVQKQNEGIKYELNFKGNNFTNSVPAGGKSLKSSRKHCLQ